jgi:hypothetical protein
MRKTRGKLKPAAGFWFGAVGATGFGFGLVAERRPFGDDMLAHPFLVYFFAVATALLVLRLAARRPVPEIIPERMLIAGCLLGCAMYLAGNFAAIHLIAR